MIHTEATVARGVAALYVANIVTLVLNTAFLVLLTNYVSQTVVGLVSLLNVVVVSSAILAVLALPLSGTSISTAPPAVTRFLSLGTGGQAGSTRSVYLLSLTICAAVSGAIGLVIALPPVSAAIAQSLSGSWVSYAAVDAVVYSFAQLGAYSLLGVGRATSAGKAVIAASVVRYLLASALLVSGFGVPGVFAGFAVGDLVLAGYGNFRSYRAVAADRGPPAPLRPVLKYMVSVLAAAVIGLGVSQMDKLLAYFQKGLGDLALYNVATVGAAVASFAPAAATNVLVPALSAFASQPERRREILRSYTRYITFTAAPMGIGLAAVSPFLLRVFGDVYAQAAPLLAIMSVSISFTAIASVYASELLVEDRAHYFTLSNLAGLAALVGIAVVSVPYIQLAGIAAGRAAMLVVTLALVAYFVRGSRELALDSAGYVKSIAASSVMGVILYGTLSLAQSYMTLGRAAVISASILMIPVGLALYLAIMKLFGGFDESDVEFLEMLFPGRLKWLADLARHFL